MKTNQNISLTEAKAMVRSYNLRISFRSVDYFDGNIWFSILRETQKVSISHDAISVDTPNYRITFWRDSAFITTTLL